MINQTALNTGWYAVTADATIADVLYIDGDVNLILCDGATLKAKAGIQGTEDTLTIWAQSDGDGMGALEAYSNSDGICSVGLTVNGGIVTAIGGLNSIYILSHSGDATMAVNGGSVTATSSSYGICILSNSGDATMAVNGGSVTATGDDSDGIYLSSSSGDATMTVNGGSVSASGSNYSIELISDSGAATMAVTGGSVSATTGDYGEGISASSITLNWDDSNGVPDLPEITATSYSGTVKLVKGFKVKGGDAAFAPTNNANSDTKAAMAGKTLVPAAIFNITTSVTGNGALTTDPANTAEASTTVAITATPDKYHELTVLTVTDANKKPVAVGDDNTFTMPASDVTVAATFAPITVTIKPGEVNGQPVPGSTFTVSAADPDNWVTKMDYAKFMYDEDDDLYCFFCPKKDYYAAPQGYVFGGWRREDTGDMNSAGAPEFGLESYTLVAQWAVGYPITGEAFGSFGDWIGLEPLAAEGNFVLFSVGITPFAFEHGCKLKSVTVTPETGEATVLTKDIFGQAFIDATPRQIVGEDYLGYTAMFTMPACPVTLTAEFDLIEITLKPGTANGQPVPGSDIVISAADPANWTTTGEHGKFRVFDDTYTFYYPDCPYDAPDGYVFIGWLNESDGIVSHEGQLDVADTYTLTAQWGRKHTITVEDPGELGTCYGLPQIAGEGEILTFAFILPPEKYDMGYRLKAVKLTGAGGGEATLTQDTLGRDLATEGAIALSGQYLYGLRFGMPDDDITVSWVFIQPIDPQVTLEGWTYGDAPNEPVVTGNPGNGEVTFTYAKKGSDDFSEDVPTRAITP